VRPLRTLGKVRNVRFDRRIEIESPVLYEHINKVSVSGLVMDAMPNRVVSVFGVRSSQLAKPNAR